jgi:hypothetical protein
MYHNALLSYEIFSPFPLYYQSSCGSGKFCRYRCEYHFCAVVPERNTVVFQM